MGQPSVNFRVDAITRHAETQRVDITLLSIHRQRFIFIPHNGNPALRLIINGIAAHAANRSKAYRCYAVRFIEDHRVNLHAGRFTVAQNLIKTVAALELALVGV